MISDADLCGGGIKHLLADLYCDVLLDASRMINVATLRFFQLKGNILVKNNFNLSLDNLLLKSQSPFL